MHCFGVYIAGLFLILAAKPDVMKKLMLLLTVMLFIPLRAQDKKIPKGHENTSKFRQMYDLLPTPNRYRSANGAPGPDYYQNYANYNMNIQLIDHSQQPVLRGEETIEYINNSPDILPYLWVQLDQNRREPNSFTEQITPDGDNIMLRPGRFVSEFTNQGYQGGFHIESVTDADGRALPYTINYTMMRVDLRTPLRPGEKTKIKIKWWYNINNFKQDWARSGYEDFPDGEKEYIIAQFYPRMAVYNDVEGWQTNQFIGTGEFALPFGEFTVNITAPADFVIDGTGHLLNRMAVLTPEQWRRWLDATKTYDRPVIVVTGAEVKQKIQNPERQQTKTWHFHAKKVRDFAFAASRRFIYDAMAVKIGGKSKMAVSMYPPEGNPLWEKYSTRVVAHTLKSYSDILFDYPYRKAISVNAFRQGMEYPMICWNYGRPGPDGKYSERTKYGMIGVIIHEVGHNWFPMVVNSDERQWMWMDEGLNTFVQLLTEQRWQKGFPSRGFPKDIVPFMMGDQSKMQPIMVNADNMYNRSMTAYSKPAAGLYMLREVILGHKLFDHALKTYANRWKFKHPTPADFFRTIEDASGTDLDWFWRGWFYTTGVNDIGIKKVSRFYVTDRPTTRIKNMAKRYGIKLKDLPKFISLVSEDSPDFSPEMKKQQDILIQTPALKQYLETHFDPNELKNIKAPKYFYQVVFEKNGELVMPIILRVTYDDGTQKTFKYPAEIWRFNDKEVKKLLVSDKKIVKFEIDPDGLTADVNTDNNIWPRDKKVNRFNRLKKQLK